MSRNVVGDCAQYLTRSKPTWVRCPRQGPARLHEQRDLIAPFRASVGRRAGCVTLSAPSRLYQQESCRQLAIAFACHWSNSGVNSLGSASDCHKDRRWPSKAGMTSLSGVRSEDCEGESVVRIERKCTSSESLYGQEAGDNARCASIYYVCELVGVCDGLGSTWPASR